MKCEDLLYDIKEIKSLLEDDTDIDDLWLLNKINMYRSVFIPMEYDTEHTIQPSWIQRLHKQTVTKVNSADDPSITVTSIYLGKVTIPRIIGLPDNLGLYRVSGSGGITSFQPIDFNTLIMKIDIGEEIMGDYGYCSLIGNDLYLYPLVSEMQALIIAEDPFDVPINASGTIRALAITDDYPINGAMAQRIVLEILTKDLAINEQSLTDTINDSQSQLRILRSGNSQQQAVGG